jgi:hypothetical protein
VSLYSREEICSGCAHAEWIEGDQFWDGARRFARCGRREELSCDGMRGTCRYHTLRPETKKGGTDE